MTRRRFTERQALECAIQQGAIIPCYRCKTPFTVETVRTAEREHLHEVALDGPDTVQGCAYSCRACHAAITRGTGATTAGSSIGRIAKTKRIQRTGKMSVTKPPTGTERHDRPAGHRMQGRPFPPRGSRPMNRKRRCNG
jgi:hypothetical protein